MSRDSYSFWIFFRKGITVLSFIIVGYVWQIVGKGEPFWPPPIREQLRKSLSWIGLRIIHKFPFIKLWLYTSRKRNWQKRGWQGGILIYLKSDIKFKVIKDISVSDGDNECVTVEIKNKNSKNWLTTCRYRLPSGAIKGPDSFLENAFKKANTKSKLVICCWDFQSKLFEIQRNLEIWTFSNGIFAYGCIPFITKLTRVTSKTVSLIDNIFTNLIFDTSLKLRKGIIKSNVSDHFPVFVSLYSLSKIHKEYQKIAIHKRVMHDTKLMTLKQY